MIVNCHTGINKRPLLQSNISIYHSECTALYKAKSIQEHRAQWGQVFGDVLEPGPT